MRNNFSPQSRTKKHEAHVRQVASVATDDHHIARARHLHGVRDCFRAIGDDRVRWVIYLSPPSS